MAQIDFYAAGYNLNGSGLGFFGSGFGASVAVGSYQDTTYITNSTGTVQGQQVNNIKYQNTASGIVNSASSGIPLTSMSNDNATLNIRFTHSSAVKAENVRLRIYDRSNINNNPSGVTAKVAEIIHPYTVQTNVGSGDTTWSTPMGSSSVVTLANSPTASGFLAGNGTNSTAISVQHDWYIALSESPDSIGSKTLNGLYVSLEYI